MQNLDKIDIQILSILQKDSNTSVKEIAKGIGLSPTPTYERIKYLEESGVIQKYVAIVDPAKIGLNLIVYCNILLKEQSRKALLEFESTISGLPEVMEVISVSGTYDYMLKIVAKDISAYNTFVMDVLSDIPNIGQYHSNIVMSIPKRETAFPVTAPSSQGS